MTGQTEEPLQEARSIDLYPLPEGWKWVTVSDAGAHQKNAIVDGPFGSNLKVSDYVDGGPVPVLTTKNLEGKYGNVRYITKEKFEELKRSAVYPGDILMAKIGSCGKTGIYPPNNPPAMIPANLLKVSLNDQFELKYVYYYFNSSFFQKALRTITKATAQPAFGVTSFRKLPLPYTTRDQQKLIVAEIEKQFSRLDEAVANLKRVKANLKRYKASVLKAAVEGNLSPTERPWKQVALGDIATSIRNGYSKKPDVEKGTRIFRISAVRLMKLDTNDVRYLSGGPAEYHSFLIESGDVLFTRYNGNRDYVGVCARVPASLPPTVYPDKLIRVRVPDSMLLPEFLVILASAGRAREYIESKIRTTAGQSGISGGDLKSLPLDIPGMAEQRQIVAEVERRLSVLEKLEAAVNANLTRADRLRQSILSQAFSGRLVGKDSKGIPDTPPAFSLAAERQARYGERR